MGSQRNGADVPAVLRAKFHLLESRAENGAWLGRSGQGATLDSGGPSAHTGAMSFGTGPFTPWAAIKAFGRKREAAAEAVEASERQAALDEEELHELDEAEYAAVAPTHHISAPARQRSVLDRLLGR